MHNIVPVLEKLDPIVINSLFQAAQMCSSTALALTIMFQDGIETTTGFERLSLNEAVNIARVDEQFQQSKFGVVEGAHDYQKIDTLMTFASARSLVQLSALRDF